MVTSQLNGVVRQLRRVALGLDAECTDGELLERYLEERDELAFEALVRRHGPMVLGVCRRVLQHAHDAEDAFQAVFLVLVRKADAVHPRDNIGPWLHGVACRTALKARTMSTRRRTREDQFKQQCRTESANDEVWHDLKPILDRELQCLAEKYRDAVVLCDLEGKSRKEAAALLGCYEGTLSSRLATARKLLAQRLARRGLAVSLAALTPWLTQQASAAVSPTLLENTLRAATWLTLGKTAGVISTQVLSLTEGVIQAMFLSKLKNALVVMAVVGILAAGTGLLSQAVLADKPAPIKSPDAPKKEAKPAADAPKKEAKPDNPNKEAKGEKKEQGATLTGRLVTVDATKNTITIITGVKGEAKKTEEKTIPLAADAKIFLDDIIIKDKTKQTALPEGKLKDLGEGTEVSVQLSADSKSAVVIHARAPGLSGNIKSVNNDSITIGTKSKDGAQDMTFALAKDVQILRNDGLGSKGNDGKKEASTPDQEGKLSDLSEGTPVSVRVTVDRKTVLQIRVMPRSISGELKGVDNGTNTITILVKEDGNLVEKSFKLAKDASLRDLSDGGRVNLRFSVFDKDLVVAAQGAKDK